MSISCTNTFIKVRGNDSLQVCSGVSLVKARAVQTKERELWSASRPTVSRVSVGV